MVIGRMIFAGVICLNLASVQSPGGHKMIGNMRVIIAKEKTIIFRNNYEGKDSSKLQLFQKGMSEGMREATLRHGSRTYRCMAAG